MIDVIITALIVCMLAAALTQSRPQHLYPAIIFGGLTFLYDFLGYVVPMMSGPGIPAPVYYYAASIVDAAIIYYIKSSTVQSIFGATLQRISLVSITLNGLSVIAYELYLQTVGISIAFALLYLYAIYVMLRREGDAVNRHSSRMFSSDMVRADHYTRSLLDQTNRGEK